MTGEVLLEGPLATIRLHSLLQLVEMDRCTGLLEVEGAGSITVRDGAVTDATCGDLRGRAAAVELCLVESGWFRFTEMEAQGHPSVLASAADLALDACRAADEWRTVRWSVLAGPAGPVALDGRRCLDEIVAASGASRHHVSAWARAGLSAGRLRILGEAPAVEARRAVRPRAPRTDRLAPAAALVRTVATLQESITRAIDASYRAAQGLDDHYGGAP